ncbi:uncharacterized protein M6B38_340325 [Iris pallida]|uniref:Uncharacterized protein n=1 Tax=Iris pallida TaxID=29817 RepID=A0AAX6GYG9_IRIPA|nr:uncharacterized protein M6B38_340325 [Iris pallida]
MGSSRFLMVSGWRSASKASGRRHGSSRGDDGYSGSDEIRTWRFSSRHGQKLGLGLGIRVCRLCPTRRKKVFDVSDMEKQCNCNIKNCGREYR